MSIKNYLKIACISIPLALTPIISYASSFDDFIRNAGERAEEIQEDAKRKYEDEGRKFEKKYQEIERDVRGRAEEHRQNLEERIRSGELQSNIERVINYRPSEDDVRRAIEFQRKFDSQIQNTELNIIRNIPIYDPRDGRVKTYDSLLREMVQQNPGLSGSAIYEDPVRFGFLVMLGDSNYLMNAKLIKINSNWMSINEAYQNGVINEASFLRLKKDYEGMQKAYSYGNVESLNNYTSGFVSDLNRINSPNHKNNIGINDLFNKINIDSDLIKELREKVSFNKPTLKEFKDVSIDLFYNSKLWYREFHSSLGKLYKKTGLNKDASSLAAHLTLFGFPTIYLFLKINKFRKWRNKKSIDKLADGEVSF